MKPRRYRKSPGSSDLENLDNYLAHMRAMKSWQEGVTVTKPKYGSTQNYDAWMMLRGALYGAGITLAAALVHWL